MTKYQLSRPGAPWDYPTLGFTATADGAILDGTLFTPDLEIPPDVYWDVYVGGDPETDVTRYATPSTDYLNPVPESAEGSILTYSRTANQYVQTLPTDAVDPETPLGAALSTAIAGGTKDLRGDVMLGLVAALESGTQSCGINVLSDSTGVPGTSWPYLLANQIAADYPDLTVHTRDWNDTNQDYDRPTVIQTGAAGERRMVMNATSPAAPTMRGPAVTGDYDIRVCANMVDWTPNYGAVLFMQYDTVSNNAFRWTIGDDDYMRFTWFPDGTFASGITKQSSVTVPITNGTKAWVRVVHDIDNGAGGNDVKFYTSSDGVTWTQLGSTQTTAGVTTHFAATQYYQLGFFGASAQFYEVEHRNGINGATVLPRMADLWNYTIGTGPAAQAGAPVVTVAVGAQNGAGIGYDDTDANLTGYLNDATRLPKLLPDFGSLAFILSTGINELEMGGHTWATRLGAWVNSVKALLPNADPIVLTSVPVVSSTYSKGPRRRRPWTLAYGQRDATVHVIDTAQAFLDDGRSLTGVLLGGDEVHPTTAGYIVMASPIIANYEAARQRVDFQAAT